MKKRWPRCAKFRRKPEGEFASPSFPAKKKKRTKPKDYRQGYELHRNFGYDEALRRWPK